VVFVLVVVTAGETCPRDSPKFDEAAFFGFVGAAPKPLSPIVREKRFSHNHLLGAEHIFHTRVVPPLECPVAVDNKLYSGF
jgi:hypothetical protein